jgi:hypothetical protein
MHLKNRSRDQFLAEYRKARPAVLDRDESRCRKCGHAEGIEVHHVNGFEDNGIDALVTLCDLCHGAAPTGEAYWEWEKSGRSGPDIAQEFFALRFPELPIATIRGLVRATREYDQMLTLQKLRSGRARRKTATGRCEGQKPYGTHNGESAILSDILRLRSDGMSAKAIAESLNAGGVATRRGAKWHPFVVTKILRANGRVV